MVGPKVSYMSGVMNPISRVITPGTHYKAICRSYNPLLYN